MRSRNNRADTQESNTKERLGRRNVKIKKTANTLTKKEKKKVEKGVNQILRPIRIIKYSAIVLGIVNLALPTIHGVLGFKSIWNWILCCVYFYAFENSTGKFMEYNIPIGWILAVRTIEFVLHLFPMFESINLVIFFILCVGDVLFLILLWFHKSNYEFEVEYYDK